MFKRIRQLNISLAAKCQILFGAAVVAIILAALYWPWQRMEQLMEELNAVAARTVGQTALAQHVSTGLLPEDLERPALILPLTTLPSTLPATTQPIDRPVPKLVWAGRDPATLNKFDQRAIEEFREQRDADVYARYYDSRTRYRLALPLYAEESCLSCHANAANVRVDPAVAATPLFAARKGELLGVMTIDMESSVSDNQFLLNKVFFITAGVIAGTLAIVVFYLITTRLILQPVRVLQETAEKVSEGDLNIRSDINTGDEFQQLSETFNTMLTNLKQSADQLRAMNKALDTKLGELAETNVALYESNRLKSEFLANVSHELRTPLNSILGFAELLRDANAEAKTQRYIQNIQQSGKNLLDLINDLLDLAKIEAGRMEVRSEPASLSDLFEGLTGILKPLLQQKDLTIEPLVAPDVPILQTDPAKLQQVLYNFLSNAIKFSPPGSAIQLQAEREDERVKISVTDRGPGIDKDKQAIIFEKFRQLDAGHTRQHSGTGLGLAISKELTALLGGSIGVTSSAGEGATFWITLPTKITAGAQDLRQRISLI